MARTVTEAFDVLLSRIPPSEAVTEKARRHRDAIEACLRANFAVNKFMAVGSFGHGTNIPRYSDIDYFMVTPEDELSSNSPRALREVKGAEYDAVIAYALLEGMVPHFSDDNGPEAAKRLLYVVCSRARKNLHLVSENGRMDGRGQPYEATRILAACQFAYDHVPL